MVFPIRFIQHPHDGNMMVDLKDIIAIDIAADQYHALVFIRDGSWIRLKQSFHYLSQHIYQSEI